MSNRTNTQILEQLWEELEELGGIVRFCNKVDLSSKSLTETDVIELLKKEIIRLKK